MTSTLSGIDGRNPCGFFAALGTQRLLADHLGDDAVQLAWTAGEAGTLRPVLSLAGERDDDDVVRLVLAAHEARDLEAELGWESDVMKLSCERVRDLLISSPDPRAAQTIGGCVLDVPRRRQGRVHPDYLAVYTPLRLIPRMGRARFVSTSLSASQSLTSERQVRAALFGPWRYEKVNSMRWDPGAPPSLRAYSAEAPTNFGPLGVPAAVALAVAGLCYFPLVATSDGRAACRGFDSPRASVLRWPLWRQPLDESAVRITLGLPAIYEAKPNNDLLARHGILARISARREQLGNDDQVLSWGETHLVSTGAR
ncbi:MAG TPA: hypothetical protein VGO48_12925 [Conexibacter sp.]|jgi:hypothetical protein|nr:hypothetical protein [Conexibacter sp.]